MLLRRGRGAVDIMDVNDEDLFAHASRPAKGPGSRGGRVKTPRATTRGARPSTTVSQGKIKSQ